MCMPTNAGGGAAVHDCTPGPCDGSESSDHRMGPYVMACPHNLDPHMPRSRLCTTSVLWSAKARKALCGVMMILSFPGAWPGGAAAVLLQADGQGVWCQLHDPLTRTLTGVVRMPLHAPAQLMPCGLGSKVACGARLPHKHGPVECRRHSHLHASRVDVTCLARG